MHSRFLIFTDLHVDMMHDTPIRAEVISRAVKEAKVDFVVQLGDLMYPDEAFLKEHSPHSLGIMKEVRPWAVGRDDERFSVLASLENTGVPVYHTLGNHDMHICDKETMVKFLNMPGRFYDFVWGGVRFVVLDTNFVMTDEGVLADISCGSGAGQPGDKLKFLTEEQLVWLEKTVMESREPCVLFSHASLADPLSGIRNRQEFFALIDRVNRDQKRILAAFNGHSHIDGMRMYGGTAFININSASYHWMGGDYECIRYSEKMSACYPRIKRTAPYHAPLYAIVDVEDEKIRIKGTKSLFVGKTPQELGLPREENDFDPCAMIRSRTIKL